MFCWRKFHVLTAQKDMKVYWQKDVKTTRYEKLTIHSLLGARKWHDLLV